MVIIDLEDAVDAAHKDAARANVLRYLADRPPGAGVVHVRSNDLRTPRGRDDLAALAGAPGLDGIRLPKVDSATDLDRAGDLIGDIPLYVLLESAFGLSHVDEIAAHPRTAGIGLGEQDLAAELSITDERALDQLRVQVVVAAAAAGVGPVPMSVYADVTDEAGLRASCAHGRALGMFGRGAIHPRQVPVIRAAFRPTEAEVASARAIVDAAAEAGQHGVGAFVLPDGRFVDAPIIAKARSTLAQVDGDRQDD